MAATYTEVSLEEMEKFLKRAFRILRPKKATAKNGEICYDLSLSPNVAVRVMTSVMASGRPAGVGEDAIRILLWSSKMVRPLTGGKAPIVKRTQGWKTNLQDRVEDAMELYEDKDDYWESRANPGAASYKEKDDRDTDLDDRAPEAVKPPEEKPPAYNPPPARVRSPGEAIGTFTRLKNGDWGLRVEGDVEPGDKVKTTRRDGKVQWLVAGEIVWKGRSPTGTPLTVTTISNSRTASIEFLE